MGEYYTRGDYVPGICASTTLEENYVPGIWVSTTLEETMCLVYV